MVSALYPEGIGRELACGSGKCGTYGGLRAGWQREGPVGAGPAGVLCCGRLR